MVSHFLQVKIYTIFIQLNLTRSMNLILTILYCEKYRKHNSSPNLHFVKLSLNDLPKFMLI